MTRAAKILIILGFALLALSLGMLLLLHFGDTKAQEDAEALLRQLDILLPPPTPGVPDTYRVPVMPTLEVGGRDVVAVVEIPAFGLRLPVLGSFRYWVII